MDTAVHEIADGRLAVLDVGGECRPRGLSFNQFLMRRTSSCCWPPTGTSTCSTTPAILTGPDARPGYASRTTRQ